MLEEQDKTMYDADIDDEIAREERESGVADSNVHHQPRDAASCMTKRWGPNPGDWASNREDRTIL